MFTISGIRIEAYNLLLLHPLNLITSMMKKIYGIVGTQRSGSNYICSGLRSMEGLGDPREYYNPVHIHEEGKLIQSQQRADIFAAELVANLSETEYFGFKIHYLQFFDNFLSNNIDFVDAFPGIKVVFLRRADVAKQAISLWKAELSQSWTAEMSEKRESHYSFNHIRSRYYDLKIHDLMWEHYLQQRGICFLNMIYEDIERNENKFFYNLTAFLGCTEKLSQMKKPDLRKQANQQSDEWRDRFLETFINTPEEENRLVWNERRDRWNAKILSDDPSVWRAF